MKLFYTGFLLASVNLSSMGKICSGAASQVRLQDARFCSSYENIFLNCPLINIKYVAKEVY